MLRGEGMQRRETVKSNNRSNQQKQLCTCSTFFFLCRCFARLQRETSRNVLVQTLYGGNVVRVPVHFFSPSLIFTLHWWPLAFLILSPPLQNFHLVLPTEKCLVCFFISRSKSLSPFFSLSHRRPRRSMCHLMNILIFTRTNYKCDESSKLQ